MAEKTQINAELHFPVGLGKGSKYIGTGNANLSGFVKLSDTPNAKLDVNSGTAATPKALAELEKMVGGGMGYIVTPEIIAPTEGSADVIVFATITGTPYRCVFEEEVRTVREFQIARDIDFTDIAVSKELDADTWTLTAEEKLSVSTTYYVRCRDKSENFVSGWSKVVSFTTSNVDIAPLAPTITIPDTVYSGMTIQASAFTMPEEYEDTHESTTWIVEEVEGREGPVFQSLKDTEHKTSIEVPAETLSEGTNYRITVIYYGTTYGASAAAVKEFRTAEVFQHIETPRVSVLGGTSNVGPTPTLQGSNFTVLPSGVDTHVSSSWVLTDTSDNSEVYRLADSATNKTSLTLEKGKVAAGKTYKVTLTYKGQTYGESAAGEVTFSTMTEFTGVPAPGGGIGDGDLGNLDTDDVFEGGDFEDLDNPSATLKSISWELYKGEEKVWTWLNAPPYPKLYSFQGYTLLPDTDYVLKFRYQSSTGTWSNWSEIHFHTASVLNYPTIKFKMKNTINLGKICKWFNSEQIKVYKNGEYDEEMTQNYTSDHTLSAEGDIIEIKNETDPDNYPYVCFAQNSNLISVEAPLPRLRQTSRGTIVSDFGGDVGNNTGYFVSNTSSSNGEDKYGMFYQCSSLIKLPPRLFRYNPQVKNFGGMGGGGGGGNGGSGWQGGDGGGGGGGGYAGGGGGGAKLASHDDATIGVGGKATVGAKASGGRGGMGTGCFCLCTALTTIPEDLFASCVNATNFGGYGGGGGGGGGAEGGSGGSGGGGYGCFARCSKLATIPEDLFASCVNATNFGGYGGGCGGNGGYSKNGGSGGAGYGCFTECSSLAEIPSGLFSSCINATNFNGYGGYSIDNKGGMGYGCFAGCSSLTEIPSGLFSSCTKVTNFEYYGTAPAGSSSAAGGGGGYGTGYKSTAEIYNGFDGGKGGGFLLKLKGGDGAGAGGAIAGAPYNTSVPQPYRDKTQGIFYGCSKLTTIPVDLFSSMNNLYVVTSIFQNCSRVTPNLRFSARYIKNADNFANGAESRGVVYVPSGSTSATTFKQGYSAYVNVVEE